jgi:MFS family permease
MPFVVLSLLFIGFSESLGGWLHGMFLSGSAITRTMTVIGILGLFVGMFDLFNMFVSSVYFYLFNDVVPKQFIGTFLSWFRLVGVLSSAGYQYFLYKYALSHMTAIYTGAALLYFFGFGAMCFMIKEGEYPPPDDAGEAPSLWRDIKLFAKHCYSIPYYWDIFLHTTCNAVSGSIMIFAVFFLQSMGLDLDLIGKLGGINSVIIAVCLVFAGILVDRFNPVRTEAYLLAFNLCGPLVSCAWIFAVAPDPRVYFWTFVTVSGVGAILTSMTLAAAMPRLMMMFPGEMYGQFNGAQALVRSAGVMLGGFLAGVYLDVVKRFFAPDDLHVYRFIYPWIAIFSVLGYIFHYRAYRCWKRLGAEESIPPRACFRYADLPKAKRSGVDRKLLIVPFLAFCGQFGASLFYMYYFQFSAPNPRNVLVFGVLSGLLVCFFLAYLRFLRFMERP